MKNSIRSISGLKKYYEEANPDGHWFSKEAMRFFNSRLDTEHVKTVKGKTYFISSERTSRDTKRGYTVRVMDMITGAISPHTKFNASTYEKAVTEFNKIG